MFKCVTFTIYMLWNIVIWPMAIPDEKYQNSPTGGQRSPTGGGGLKPPCAPPVAPRLTEVQLMSNCHWLRYVRRTSKYADVTVTATSIPRQRYIDKFKSLGIVKCPYEILRTEWTDEFMQLPHKMALTTCWAPQ